MSVVEIAVGITLAAGLILLMIGGGEISAATEAGAILVIGTLLAMTGRSLLP